MHRAVLMRGRVMSSCSHLCPQRLNLCYLMSMIHSTLFSADYTQLPLLAVLLSFLYHPADRIIRSFIKIKIFFLAFLIFIWAFLLDWVIHWTTVLDVIGWNPTLAKQISKFLCLPSLLAGVGLQKVEGISDCASGYQRLWRVGNPH